MSDPVLTVLQIGSGIRDNFGIIARPVSVRRYGGKFMECSINSPALSLFMKHLVIGQRQKAPNFSAFHWSPHSSLVSIGQHLVITNILKSKSKQTETLNRTRLCRPCELQ